MPQTQVTPFRASRHISITGIQHDVEDENGHRVTIFHLPWTKVAGRGEDVFWAEQADETDPKAALAWHIRTNRPAPEEHLFSYDTYSRVGARVRKPLAMSTFLARLRKLARVTPEVAALTGHSFRIGGTVWCLLRNMPFDVVKAKGRWKSDSFQLYLRRHAEIMAPYVQASGRAWRVVLQAARNDVANQPST